MPSQPVQWFNVGAYIAAGVGVAGAIASAIADANTSGAGGLVFIPASVPSGGSIAGLGPNTVVMDFRGGHNVYAANLTGSGHSPQVALVSLSGQTAALGSTVLLPAAALPGTGLYRAGVSVILTAAGTGGTISASLVSHNGVASVTQAGSTLSTTAALGAEVDSTFTFYHGSASTAINYLTTFASVTGSPAYALRLRLEWLG